MIDIGANLSHECFDGRIEDVLAEAGAAGVEHIIVTGSDLDCSAKAGKLAQGRAQLSFTAGIHPHHARPLDGQGRAELARLWSLPSCVAIGEMGLDYNRMHQPAEVQRRCLLDQLEASAGLALPLFLHLREADEDLLEILRDHARDRAKVVHCYTGGAETLRKLLDLGAMIGITGWLCDHRRNHDLVASLGYLPLDRVMIESDAPYLLPRTIEGFRRIRHNHPRYLPWVLDELAARMNLEIEELAAITRANAIDFFGLEMGEKRNR